MRFTIIMFLFISTCSLAWGQAQNAAAPTPPPVVAPGAQVEKVADGFDFVEGPVWHSKGYLLFTDIPRNRIMRWHPKDGVGVFREPSQKANGLTLDQKQRLTAAEHDGRRVSRTEPDGKVVSLVEQFEGKRLNSPNDLVYAPDGSIYFTDPPFGLPRMTEGKELDFNGVYRLSPSGQLTLLVRDFQLPNGIALSPDRKTLYVADTGRLHVRAFDIKPDGSLAGDRIFAQLQPWSTEVQGRPDGMKVDTQGNLYVTGPGGVWVFDKTGQRLGVIVTPEVPANCGFGDGDMKTLYITARKGLYRIRLNIAGLK